MSTKVSIQERVAKAAADSVIQTLKDTSNNELEFWENLLNTTEILSNILAKYMPSRDELMGLANKEVTQILKMNWEKVTLPKNSTLQ